MPGMMPAMLAGDAEGLVPVGSKDPTARERTDAYVQGGGVRSCDLTQTAMLAGDAEGLIPVGSKDPTARNVVSEVERWCQVSRLNAARRAGQT